MKKLFVVLLTLLCLTACGQKKEENEIAKLLKESYNIEASSFDDKSWRGLLNKDDSHIIVVAKMSEKLYEECHEVFFEDEEAYIEFLKKLEVSKTIDVSDKVPTKQEQQIYVGKTMGDLEEEGFENTGYIESDNYQYNFFYENEELCLTVKSSPDTPITNMDDFSVNDLKELVICEVVDCTISSNILYNEEY